MRILQLHSNFIVFKPVEKEIAMAEEAKKEEAKKESERIVKKTEDYLGQDGKFESDFIDEWTPELEKLREEASKPVV